MHRKLCGEGIRQAISEWTNPAQPRKLRRPICIRGQTCPKYRAFRLCASTSINPAENLIRHHNDLNDLVVS